MNTRLLLESVADGMSATDALTEACGKNHKGKKKPVTEAKRPEEVLTDMEHAMSRVMDLFSQAKRKGDEELLSDLSSSATDWIADLQKIARS